MGRGFGCVGAANLAFGIKQDGVGRRIAGARQLIGFGRTYMTLLARR